ncbi:plastocyanin/azurin family copper-binding protein [Halomontanus rarus]|uniref:plastocyanin/azurin family copper-binding protein n=1 Tax=Halomontanus rarus TaxID=3034020 RepID=UPI001A99AFC0
MVGKQTRRHALRAGGLLGVTALTGLAGCLAERSSETDEPTADSADPTVTETASESNDSVTDLDDGKTETETNTDPDDDADELVDATGQDTVEIAVGPDSKHVFAPDSVAIDPGTTVQFVWESEADHNINPREQPDDAGWGGHVDLEGRGHEYEHTFDVDGVYEYQCDPHIAIGMVGTIVVGDVDWNPSTDEPDEADETDTRGDPIDWTDRDEAQITVGPDSRNVFEPEAVTISPKTTLRWVWKSDTHNVNPTSQPEDADWTGHSDIADEGNEYEHHFAVPGEYDYQCDPHIGLGMIGTVIVEND